MKKSSLIVSLVSTIVVLANKIDEQKNDVQLNLNEQVNELLEMDLLTLKEFKLALHQEYIDVTFA